MPRFLSFLLCIVVLNIIVGCSFLEEHGEAISEGINEVAIPIVDAVPSPIALPAKIVLGLVAGVCAYYGGRKGVSHLKKKVSGSGQ